MKILFNVESYDQPHIDNEIFPIMLTFKRVLPEYLKDVETIIEMQRGFIIVNIAPGDYHLQYFFGGSWDDYATHIQTMLNNFDQDKMIFNQHGDVRLN